MMSYKSMPASAIVMATHEFQTNTTVAQDGFKITCVGNAFRLYACFRYKKGARLRDGSIEAKDNIETSSAAR